MDALISGQAGVAVFIQGDEASVVRMDASEVERWCSPTAIPYVFDGAVDVVQLRSTTKQDVLQTLRSKWQLDRALQLALILLSDEEENALRKTVGQYLIGLLAEKQLYESLENLLFAVVLPSPTTIENARGHVPPSTPLSALLTNLENNQETIRHFWEKWDTLPKGLFEDASEKEAFRSVLINSGSLKRLVKASQDSSRFGLAVVEAHQNIRHLPNYRSILNAWLAELKPPRVGTMDVLAAIKREERTLEKQLGKLQHQLNRVRGTAKAWGHSTNREVTTVKKGVRSAATRAKIAKTAKKRKFRVQVK